MVGEFFIKRKISNTIRPQLAKYITNERDLEDAVKGLTNTAMMIINVIGIKKSLQLLQFAREINLLKAENVTQDPNSVLPSDDSTEPKS